jgi:hypothetical protein
MRFIELDQKEGGHVLVNVHNILTIERNSDGFTEIVMADALIFVRETPDEIMLKIRG